jgi:hypothetical protein
MGTYYRIQTEVKVRDVWHCIDPLTLRLGASQVNNNYRLSPTYESGSRSFFGQAEEKLREMSIPFSYDDLSKEYQSYCETWHVTFSDLPSYVEKHVHVISLDSIKEAVERYPGKTNHGLVHKDALAEYEAGETLEIYSDISPQEYSELDPEARKVYQYYEWDDAMHWLPNLRDILETAVSRISLFENDNDISESLPSRIILEII